MSAWARVPGGVVAELFTPPSGFTIAQCFHPDIASQFVAVPSGVTPAEGWSYSGGVFAAPPPPAPPPVTPASAYAALLTAGATVASTSTPTLNGTYAIGQDDQAKITSVGSFVQTYSEFPNGSTTNLAWVLQNGSTVEFPTTASFLVFAKAIGQLVYAADIALASGSTTMPSNAISIP